MVPDRASPVFRLVHAYTGGEHQDECADAYRKNADRIQPGHDEGLGKETNRGSLRFEVIRILLGHPYQRQPYKAKKATLGIASDMTLTSSYHNISTISLPKGLRFDSGLCFEEYYAIVKDFLDTNVQSPPYDIVGEIDDGDGGQSDDAESGGESDGSNEQENDENGSGQNDDAEK